MANRFYSVDLGQQRPELVTEGAATSGKGIEVRIADTIYTSKLEAILGLRAILNYLETRETRPIA